MKRTFILISLLALAYLSHAQGNLQFSQVVRLKNTISTSSYSASYTITVPTGTIWKIESACTYVTSDYALNTFALFIDNQVAYTGQSALPVALPIWLSAGTYTVVAYQGNAGTATANCVINGLQFNVVP